MKRKLGIGVKNSRSIRTNLLKRITENFSKVEYKEKDADRGDKEEGEELKDYFLPLNKDEIAL